jgi:hypothetical protein
MPATIRRVTAPVPGPTSRIRRAAVDGSRTNRVKAADKARPLGKTAPVVWKLRKNSRKKIVCSASRRRIPAILPCGAVGCHVDI